MKVSHKMIGVCLFFMITNSVYGTELVDKKFKFTASDRKPLRVRLEVDAGHVQINPGRDSRDIELNFHFDDKRYQVSVDFDKERNELNAYFDINKWFKDRDEEGNSSARLFVDLPTDVPIVLYCKTKAGETEIELSELYVRELTLRVLAGETYLSFPKPNKTEMGDLTIESKFGELVVDKLGNAKFTYADISSNIGELSIDFSSDISAEIDREVDIHLNIGQTRLYFPRDEAIRFSVSKFLFLSDVDVPHNFYKEGKYYYSDGFDRAKHKMNLSISPGLGTLDIRVR